MSVTVSGVTVRLCGDPGGYHGRYSGDGLGEAEGLALDDGLTEAEGETDGLTLDEGLAVADGLTDALADDEGLTDAEGLVEADGLGERLGEGDSLAEGLADAEGLTDKLGEGDSLAEGLTEGLTDAEAETAIVHLHFIVFKGMRPAGSSPSGLRLDRLPLRRFHNPNRSRFVELL